MQDKALKAFQTLSKQSTKQRVDTTLQPPPKSEPAPLTIPTLGAVCSRTFHIVMEETSLVDCLRMCILGVEEAVKAALRHVHILLAQDKQQMRVGIPRQRERLSRVPHADFTQPAFSLRGSAHHLWWATSSALLQGCSKISPGALALQCATDCHAACRVEAGPLPRAIAEGSDLSSAIASLMLRLRLLSKRVSQGECTLLLAEEEGSSKRVLSCDRPEQLPESWRGGVDRVGEVHNVDTVLLSGAYAEEESTFSGDAL
eukprot:2688253-Amphidinium_carterae.1